MTLIRSQRVSAPSSENASHAVEERIHLFKEAEDVMLRSRSIEYGHPLINFIRIALFWTDYKETRFTPLDVIFMQDLSKTAREMETHKHDNLVDKLGYTANYERIDRYMRHLGYENGAEAFRTMTIGEMHDLRDRLKSESS